MLICSYPSIWRNVGVWYADCKATSLYCQLCTPDICAWIFSMHINWARSIRKEWNRKLVWIYRPYIWPGLVKIPCLPISGALLSPESNVGDWLVLDVVDHDWNLIPLANNRISEVVSFFPMPYWRHREDTWCPHLFCHGESMIQTKQKMGHGTWKWLKYGCIGVWRSRCCLSVSIIT